MFDFYSTHFFKSTTSQESMKLSELVQNIRPTTILKGVYQILNFLNF